MYQINIQRNKVVDWLRGGIAYGLKVWDGNWKLSGSNRSMNFHHEQEKSFTSGPCCLINCWIKVMFSRTEFCPARTTGQHLSWLFSRPTAHENHSDSLTEKTDEAENQSMIHYQSEKLKQNTGWWVKHLCWAAMTFPRQNVSGPSQTFISFPCIFLDLLYSKHLEK